MCPRYRTQLRWTRVQATGVEMEAGADINLQTIAPNTAILELKSPVDKKQWEMRMERLLEGAEAASSSSL